MGYYTPLYRIEIKKIIPIMIIFFFFFAFVLYKWIKEDINYENKFNILQQQYFETKINGEIIQLRKEGSFTTFNIDTDTTEFILTYKFISNYYPNSLYENIKVGSIINKKKNSYTIRIDSINYTTDIK